MNLILKKICLCDIEILRNIRNECRNFMTRNVNEISFEEQQKWFLNLDKSYNVYLLYKVELGVIVYPIGYGILKIENDCVLVSGGIELKSRGSGYGKQLFTTLINLSKSMYNLPIKLEVLKTNIRAFSIYNSLGFVVYEDDGKVIKMVYKND